MVRERSRRSVQLAMAASAVVLALAGGPAVADLYRWVDAKGVVNYSNVPPPQTVKAEQIPETQPTVSVIPPPEKPPEVKQTEREAALVRRIEQLESELAALRRAAATPVVYSYPVPVSAPEVTYAAPIVYPYPLYPVQVYAPGRAHRFKPPGHPGMRAHWGPGVRAPVGVPRPGVSGVGVSGVSARARF
jgi:Domain of unknown function (DUF4124)